MPKRPGEEDVVPPEPVGAGEVPKTVGETALPGEDDGVPDTLPPAPAEGAVEGVPPFDGVPEGDEEGPHGTEMLGS